MATEQAAPATMTLDRSDGSATMDLYRAALGPVHTDGYLRAFTRFDAAGTSGPSWNWTAALLTLNWMLFRRLWLPALAYVGVLAAGLLLLLGIGRLLFQLPDASLWALAGLGILLAVVVPGAYGNAWLYAACNKAMTSALAASTTMEEACELLRKRTNGRPRLAGLAVGNLVLAIAVGALAWSWPGAMHGGKVESVGAVATSGLVAASATASEAGVVVAPVASEALAAPSRSSQGLVQPAPLPVTAASAPVVPASAPVAVASAASTSATANVASAAVAKASTPAKPSKAELQVKALEAKKEKLAKAKEAKEAKEAKAAKPAKDTKEKSAATTPAPTASATSNQYLINVGLFADANNARNAYAKLQDAGLPAIIKELKSAKGPQTRVRAGPFESEAEAERAAEKIRGLRLDAVVIKP